MKRILTAISMIALTTAPSAFAGDGERETTTAQNAISIEYSENFAETLEEEYGEREGDYLAEEVREDLTRVMAKHGIAYDAIKVTIIDAKPNRPTFGQLSSEPGLSFQSFGNGGMKLSATAYDAAGNVIGELDYRWFENDIRDAQGKSTWWDAKRASSRFAKKFAKQIAG